MYASMRWVARGSSLRLTAAGCAAVLACVVCAAGGAAAKATTATGFQAQSYASTTAGSAGGAVTGQKPESKLWYAQGSWWATMVVPSSGAHDIYRLVSGTWVDTGVLVDSESTSREDVLWDGTHLYVLSRTPSLSEPNRLRRFSFSGGRYVLDPGFPVNVPGGGAEAVTIAKDSTGTLWLTYASSDRVKKVMVAHSNGSDTSWGAAFALPLSPASGLKGDDISAIIAFTDATGPAIGVAWDNENLQSDFFAVHRDGASDSSWSVETTLSGTLQADDHMNLKTFEGKVYIAVKTATTTPTEPLIKLLVRSPTGSWSQYPVAPYADKNTRPIVLIDTSARQLYVFLSKGDNPAHGIYYKQTPLDSISFPSTATPFIVGANNETINDGTSTKQNLDSTTGIVVMASDGSSYWWNGTSTGGIPSNTPPTANPATVTTPAGTPVTITLTGSDVETCELGFSITAQPANGTTGGFSSQPCTPGSPNTDSATIIYTPNAGYTGSDSLSFQVTDGSGATAAATITINVTAQNTPPAASNVTATTPQETPVTVTLQATDAESCNLAFAVTQAPQNGTTGGITSQPCVPGSPNTDTATLTYSPSSGFTGTDTFTYQVTDGSGATSTATATITVTAQQNTPPSASDVSAATSAGTPVSVTLQGSDVESCNLSFAVTQAPQNGTTGSVSAQPCVAGSPNTDTAAVTYTPNAGFTGTDTFTYQVTDGSGATATATATVTVTGGGPTTIAPSVLKVTTGSVSGGDVTSLAASDDVYLSIASTTTKPQKVDWWASFGGVPASPSTLSVSFEGASTAACTQTIQIRNWTTSSWVTIDSRPAGTSDTVASGLVPPGPFSNYVDSTGTVKVLVSCSGSSGTYTFRGDQLSLTFG